jgi:hypothetical protein
VSRFVLRAHSLAELVRLGTMSGQCAGFLEAAVVTGLNIVVAGAPPLREARSYQQLLEDDRTDGRGSAHDSQAS